MDIDKTATGVEVNSSVGPIDIGGAHYATDELRNSILSNLGSEALDLFSSPLSLLSDAPQAFDDAISHALQESIHGDGIVSDSEARDIAEDHVSFSHDQADEGPLASQGRTTLQQVLSGDFDEALDSATEGVSGYIESGVTVESLSTWDKIKTLNPFG